MRLFARVSALLVAPIDGVGRWPMTLVFYVLGACGGATGWRGSPCVRV